MARARLKDLLLSCLWWECRSRGRLGARCMIPSMESEVSVFILAGGKSTRMGRDKAFVEFQGQTLLCRMLDVARQVSPNVCIVGDRGKFAAFASVIEDAFPNCGPLAGIHAALRGSRSDLNLILAVDVPFVSLAFLQYLIARAKKLPDATVTAARALGGFQPLSAVYRRDFAEVAEKSLRQQRYKIDALFDSVHTQIIAEEELEAAGFSPQVFRNLNSPQDLTAAT